MVAFLIGAGAGALVSFFVLALFIGSKMEENPCDTCKYRKVGVDPISGELSFPCKNCCNQYPDNYSEVQR